MNNIFLIELLKLNFRLKQFRPRYGFDLEKGYLIYENDEGPHPEVARSGERGIRTLGTVARTTV